MLTADELRRRGVAAINDGRIVRARTLLERALERTAEDDVLARTEASLAYVTADQGAPDAALELCRRALGRRGLTAETRGVVEAQHALLLMRQGEVAGALGAFASAVECLRAVPDELAKVFINRGGVHLQVGDSQAAAGDFELAVEQFGLAGDELNAAKAKHNLGYASLLSGDLVGALSAMSDAYSVIAPVSPVLRAICEQDRAEVLLAAGLVDEGVELLESAARTYGARRLRRRQAEAELALARRMQWRDSVRADSWARAAAGRFDRLGAHSWRARADAVAAAVARPDRTPPPERIGSLAAELDAQGFSWASLEVRLHGVRALLRDDPERARAAMPQSRRARRGPLETRLLDLDVRAELAVARGRQVDAFRHLRAGLVDLHAWQSSFGSLDLQTGVAGLGLRLAARGLALAVESGKPEVLLEWSERARMLASRVQPVRAPEDQQIVADLTELREMAAEGGRRDPEREAELRQRIRERAWQHRGSGAVADPVTLPDLQAALSIDSALVAYVVAADRVVALVVTTDAATWVDLGERTRIDALLGGLLPDLDVAASELPDAMAGFVRTALAGRLDSLAAMLVTPVLEAVGDRAVVLTPSGVLAGVPWTLLPGFVGRPVTVAQSATSWLGRRATPLRLGSAGFVAGPRVARAEEEVIATAKEWKDARVLTGADATAAAVSELAAGVDVLHVAAHGRHAAENAMFSGLQLADGPWFGYDIDQLRQVPDVVLLSACEVGRSTVRWGDELIGMATAWLHAGSRCVIASAAAVNDRAAYDVLVAVHQQLAAGVDPAAALAAAVPAVTADTAPVPLVCFG
ncbi:MULTISPECIES: CHAT domain-containing protein [unclassified Nocardioides]|uniref:CHAT domain-containing protein n=1 Tax=unclassified Nocardioides TaxID=2615069 RepID=UPI00005714CD|nr:MULTISPECIES: CHAT domain-containing protein [unclassified Nocardioides]ABL84164.1 Tetratricopeptide TPR_2 repeat protein [Nocardioides sp. JS614]